MVEGGGGKSVAVSVPCLLACLLACYPSILAVLSV